LPVEVRDGRRFATGDARALTDAESLNLVHPLVRAAIAHARTWSGGGSVTLHLPPDLSAELAALAGKVGLICVVLVNYVGFEPVQRLVAAAVVDATPIDPSLAAKLMRWQATEGPAFKVPVEAQWLDDAIDEAIFVDQRQVEEGEQKHFAGNKPHLFINFECQCPIAIKLQFVDPIADRQIADLERIHSYHLISCLAKEGGFLGE
jgi:hypothetical protein